jgi:dipeptidyl aminopeptidase/acylaminoacyl peptidase
VSCLLLFLSLAAARTSHAEVIDARREQLANAAAPAETVEYFWSRPTGEGPFPLVVLIHGHQEGADSELGGRAFVQWGVLKQLVSAGAVAVSVSRPGYGGSDGDRDHCGPRSQGAVQTVLDRFRKQPFIDPKRIALEGISCGASVAAKLATRDRRLAAVVLIAGAYDFKDTYETRCARMSGYVDSLCWAMRTQMPLDDVGFTNRSTRGFERSIGAAVLILHGGKDPLAPASQARALAASLQQLGKTVEITIFPEAAHHVPLGERQPLVDAFLERTLGVRLQAPRQ